MNTFLETTAAVPPIPCCPCSKPSWLDNGTASPIPNSNTASSPASISTCFAVFTNWLGKSVSPGLSKRARTRSDPVVVSIWLSSVVRRPLASVLSTTVNYGEGGGTPASEIVSASDAVPASLAAGQTVTVNRAFVIPAEDRASVKVVVDLGADHGAATFRGSAG